MAVELILEDGTTSKFVPSGNEGISNDEIYSLINGYFEILRLGENGFAVFDAEGRNKSLSVNQVATDRVAKYLPWFLGNNRNKTQILKEFSFADALHGPVIFLSGKEAIYFDDRTPQKDYVELDPTWEPELSEVQHGWTQDELDDLGVTFIIGPSDYEEDDV